MNEWLCGWMGDHPRQSEDLRTEALTRMAATWKFPLTLSLAGTCSPQRNRISSSPSPSLPDASFSCEEVWIPKSFPRVQKWGHNSACLSARKTGRLTP